MLQRFWYIVMSCTYANQYNIVFYFILRKILFQKDIVIPIHSRSITLSKSYCSDVACNINFLLKKTFFVKRKR